MKVIIAGSRTINKSVEEIAEYVKQSKFKITEVVCGEAQGIDKSGKIWAKFEKIPVKSFPANWSKHGKIAGILRNNEMAVYADAAIVITNGSRGSQNMILTMRRYIKPCEVFRIEDLNG